MSLDRTPAAELLGETARTWAESLWRGRTWADDDIHRIEEAFGKLVLTSETWPPPAAFVRQIPPRREPAKVLALAARIETEADRARAKRRLDEIQRLLDQPDRGIGSSEL